MHTRNFKQEKDKEGCEKPIPEDIIRRPDPCIYSQKYLQDQGIAVTWNNPDIWVAKAVTPNVIEPDSYNLIENTNYIVSVQVHNASTDVALGVKVRLVYRPWSFNSPDLVPVESDVNGNEVFKIVNIASMGSTIVNFNWRTPNVANNEPQKHFCLQAILYHPLDTNPNNNLGQENTSVYNANPNEAFSVVIPLHNTTKKEQKFFIETTNYQIDFKRNTTLTLKKNIGKQREDAANRLFRLIPLVNIDDRKSGRERTVVQKLGLDWREALTITKAKYTGFEDIRKELSIAHFSVPAKWQVKIADYDNGVTLLAGHTKDIEFSFKVPTDVVQGQEFAINVMGRGNNGFAIGGVTILIKIK